MKKLLVLSMVACMAVSAVACGSKAPEAPAEAPADTTEETPADAPAEDEAQGEEPAADAASGDKVWVIATDTDFRPFEYTDESGNFVGIDVDLLDAIAQDQGFAYDLQSLGFDAAALAVQSGQADGMIAGATINDERKASGWIFSDGYFDSNQTFAVAADSDIAGFEDLSGKNVAVKSGTAGFNFAEGLKDQYGFTVTVFEDSPTMYQDVVLGNSAACVEDTPIIANNIKDKGLELKIPEGMESESAPYGFAIMDTANQELLDMFNAGLANIRADGTYDEIIAKYIGE